MSDAPTLDTAAVSRLCDDPVMLDDWYPVARSREIVAGTITPATLLGRDLIVWRDAAGAVHVWDDLCIHRGARLSKGWIKDDTVVCPYHGWRFDGQARCVHIPVAPDQPIPPKARAFPVRAQEQDGLVWATLGKPAHPIPAFPARDLPGFRIFHAGPYVYRANGFRAVENFVDATHFPFVHSGLNGVPDAPDIIPDYDVTRSADGLVSSEISVFQPVGDFRKIPVQAGYTYYCLRPLVAAFSKRVRIVNPAQAHLGSPDDRFVTMFTVQPVDEVTSVARVVFAINFAPDLTEADMLPRQDIVYNQDRDIVETQRPERIPVDLRAEMHHRSDRMGVAYRRWLRDLGITYGVIA
ncbi:aromatic ring-hydroxylating dioxygenase subunit alpha [Gluconacetobacter azotocaptans]|uniref:aromatic ring-hydroxylating oxygenase subunit alpha n=1 Tax=Gluconacetobacter azotocaptans TaxID=142834 RepID=UPI00195D1A97|nr:aromatic ring-hydroxylating dioxygenase subunit alpha [Gluconacetobacter azotocaptans]MBM9400278.1 aromatic ring-hydroxylating dioxygenase subunit alpha [Gluconacetobacter azotocaptans]